MSDAKSAADKKLRAAKKEIERQNAHRDSESVIVCNSVVESDCFRRIAAADSSDVESLVHIVCRVALYNHSVREGHNTPEYLREYKAEVDQFDADLAATIRFLTQHASAGLTRRAAMSAMKPCGN